MYHDFFFILKALTGLKFFRLMFFPPSDIFRSFEKKTRFLAFCVYSEREVRTNLVAEFYSSKFFMTFCFVLAQLAFIQVMSACLLLDKCF